MAVCHPKKQDKRSPSAPYAPAKVAKNHKADKPCGNKVDGDKRKEPQKV